MIRIDNNVPVPKHVRMPRGGLSKVQMKAIDDYCRAYRRVWMRSTNVTFDGEWFLLADGDRNGVSLQRLKELTKQLQQRKD